MSKPRRTDKKADLPALRRKIAKQIRHMSDAEAYAFTFAGDRAVRRIAFQDCHRRAETEALSADSR